MGLLGVRRGAFLWRIALICLSIWGADSQTAAGTKPTYIWQTGRRTQLSRRKEKLYLAAERRLRLEKPEQIGQTKLT
ncbi:hypothetical protein JOQ06_024662 [Pogonophryne albipinna]|uniref:Uncharacterized protein n=1 Tax=Pogonophryne albipinna TaxID=1090488 RepID=A0AAD6F5B3_9TELE|nr:hypothetical protein JOQ06_024662 [Pogonophryne albipinna]